jgi:hypothetical protein
VLRLVGCNQGMVTNGDNNRYRKKSEVVYIISKGISAVFGQQYLQPLVAETFGAVSLPFVSFAPSVSHGDDLVWGQCRDTSNSVVSTGRTFQL